MIKESYLNIDAIAHKENLFTRVDARIKLALIFVSLSLILTLPGTKFPLLVLATIAVAFWLVQVPIKVLIARLLPPIILSVVVVILDAFLLGNETIFQVHVGRLVIVAHLDGLFMGLHLAARVLSGVALIIFLSVSTPVNELMKAATWFKMPKVLVEIFSLTYRYLFVFWDEGLRIRQAQVMRLGYPKSHGFSNWKRAIKSTSTLLGMVFIRAYDRAESACQAMQVRGYTGQVIMSNNNKWEPVQWKYFAVGIIVLMLMVAISYS